MHAQSPHFEMIQWSHVANSFWGKSIEFTHLGGQEVKLRNGHKYTWNKVYG